MTPGVGLSQAKGQARDPAVVPFFPRQREIVSGVHGSRCVSRPTYPGLSVGLRYPVAVGLAQMGGRHGFAAVEMVAGWVRPPRSSGTRLDRNERAHQPLSLFRRVRRRTR